MTAHVDQWVRYAACADEDPELWFPYQPADQAYPKSVCRSCLVKDQCLDLAMAAEGSSSHEKRYGVFGGMAPADRARMAANARRRNKRAAS